MTTNHQGSHCTVRPGDEEGKSAGPVRGVSRIILAVALAMGAATPGPALTLAEAWARVLAANPELAAAGEEFIASQGALLQARAWSNPELDVERENFHPGGAGGEALQTTVTLSQSLPLPGLRRARIRSAAAERDAARWELERRRRDLRREVDTAFIQVLGAQQRVDLAREATATAEEMLAAVAALVTAGEAAVLDRQRTAAEVSLTRLDAAAAATALVAARRELAALWGGDGASVEAVEGELLDEVAMPERPPAVAGLEGLPDLARHRAMLEVLAARRDQERPRAVSEVEVAVGRRRVAGEGSAWLAGLSLSVPLLDRNRGGLAEAEARLRAARWEMQAEVARLHSALGAVSEDIDAAAEEVAVLRDDVLPALGAVQDGMAEGYRRGKYPLLDLLEARRNLEGARMRYLEALVRLNLAGAELARLLPGGSTTTDEEDA